jgi:NAD+ synthase (glutamine-hydrolysing)
MIPKIALAQMEVIPGRPDLNVATMLRCIADAKSQKVDIIAFPEMCVGGYLVGDRWLEPEFCISLMEYNKEIKQASDGIIVIFGNIYYHETIFQTKGYHPNKDGRVRKYNAVYIFQNQQEVIRSNIDPAIIPPGIQPKTLLPNYRIFDDERYFFSLQDIAKDYGVPLRNLLQPFSVTIDGNIVKIGVEVCEDLWCAEYRQNGDSVNPTKYLIENGADFIINISASPWTFGKNGARDRRILYLKEQLNAHFVPFYYVNNIGAQNNGKNIVTFDGGTTVYNKDGQPVFFGKWYQEELAIIDPYLLNAHPLTRNERPKIAQKFDAIITGIKHLKNILGWKEQPPYVIAMSGGIDSSVVAALLVHTVGKEKVMAINLPSQYNSPQTQAIAKKVAQNLNIPYLVIPITELYELNAKIIESANFRDTPHALSVLNRENIQAKIRGTSILSNLAAKYGAIFTNNGNKMEIALGYATLYGDVNGAIAPLGDLTKTEVYALGRYLNEEIFRNEVIPSEIFPNALFQFKDEKFRPSPELKDNQVNPMKWGYHDAIIELVYTDYKKRGPESIVQWYLEGTLESNLNVSTELLDRWGLLDPKTFIEDLEWFTGLIYKNVFKRIQAPPIVITSKSAFGYDIRESQLPWTPSRKFLELKQKVLQLKTYPGKI